MKGVKWMEVQLADHDSAWRQEYELTKNHLISILGNNVIDIQHVGSTSINGISAKPILDIGIVLHSFQAMDISAMKQYGYKYMGPRNAVASRHLFMKYADSAKHDDIVVAHIHCYQNGDHDFETLVGFRDYLNAHPALAEEYDQLKRNLAEKYPNDRFAYSDGKRAFIDRIIGMLHNKTL